MKRRTDFGIIERRGDRRRVGGQLDRVNCANRDTPSPANAPLPVGRPDAIQRWTDRVVTPKASSRLRGGVLVGHSWRDCRRRRTSAPWASRPPSPAAPCWAALLAERPGTLPGLPPETRCLAMTRAVCHFADSCPGRGPRGRSPLPRAPRRPRGEEVRHGRSTAASSASSPSTTSCTSPIRRARVASNRRPPGKSARHGSRRSWRSRTGDDRRQDPQARLGEPEPGAGSAMTSRHRAQAHAAAERRALTRAITGTGQRSMASNMSAITIASCSFCPRRRASCSHPGDVGAGAERRTVAASTTARSLSTSRVRAPRTSPQLADHAALNAL